MGEAVKQRREGIWLCCIRAEQPVTAEDPEVPWLGYRRHGQIKVRQAVGHICGLLKVGDQDVDLRSLEARHLDVEVQIEHGQRLQLQGQEVLVPAGQLGQSVVGDEVSADLCLAHVRETDGRHPFDA